MTIPIGYYVDEDGSAPGQLDVGEVDPDAGTAICGQKVG